MAFQVEAVYENGILRPVQPLPLAEHERVQVTVSPVRTLVRESAGLIPCRDAALIEQAALDPDLESSEPQP
jgi:predicted DNA-binding antitoxin AbrB/MazE fold protein